MNYPFPTPTLEQQKQRVKLQERISELEATLEDENITEEQERNTRRNLTAHRNRLMALEAEVMEADQCARQQESRRQERFTLALSALEGLMSHVQEGMNTAEVADTAVDLADEMMKRLYPNG